MKEYDSSKLEEDTALVKELVECLDREKGISPSTVLETLDENVLYLRRVHYFCFWSGAEFSDERTLALKCSNVLN